MQEFQVDDGAFLSAVLLEQSAAIYSLEETVRTLKDVKFSELTSLHSSLEQRLEQVSEYVHNIEKSFIKSVQRLEVRLTTLDGKLSAFLESLNTAAAPAAGPPGAQSGRAPECARVPEGPTSRGQNSNSAPPPPKTQSQVTQLSRGHSLSDEPENSREDPFAGGLIAQFVRNREVIPHSSSIFGRQSSKAPGNLLDGDPSTFFQSERERTDPWFAVQFTKVKVKVTDYTVRGWGNASPKSWVLEGADDLDAAEWETIDEQNECRRLARVVNQKCEAAKFHVAQPGNYFQFIKLRQTGLNHNGTNFLVASQFEVFGKLIDL
jgi:hypothetical protein